MAPAKGLSNSDHTATIIVGRPESSDGKSYTLLCWIAGAPKEFGLSDGEFDAISVPELQRMTASAFGRIQTMYNLSGKQKSRSFDYTTGNSLGGALRGGSYREGERPPNLSLFIDDDSEHTWRADFPTKRTAKDLLGINHEFDIPTDQYEKLISVCKEDGSPTGETALLIQGVITLTRDEVHAAKQHYRDLHSLNPTSKGVNSNLKMKGSLADFFKGAGSTVNCSQMMDGTEDDNAVSLGQTYVLPETGDEGAGQGGSGLTYNDVFA